MANESLNKLDNKNKICYKLLRNLIDKNKSYFFKLNFEQEPRIKSNEHAICNNQECASFLVELVEDLNECDTKSVIESKFSDLVSNELLNDSFDLINKYDQFANNLVNKIFDEFKQENYPLNETESEIKIQIPNDTSSASESEINNQSAKRNPSYLLRRHSADIDTHLSRNRLSQNNYLLPDINECSQNELISEYPTRRHSLNNTNNSLNTSFTKLKSFNSVNRLNNKPIMFNSHCSKPTIIIDYEEDNNKSKATNLNFEARKSKLNDSDSEVAIRSSGGQFDKSKSNNQFKQYTKVTLKSILNKSPTSNKPLYQIHNQFTSSDLSQSQLYLNNLHYENTIKNSDFVKNLMNDLFVESFEYTRNIIR